MNLPGLLIEYLIIGSIALLWLGKLFLVIDPSTMDFDGFELLLVPLAYVLGMFIDFIAWILTKPFKKWIRNDAIKVVTKAMAEEGNANFDPDAYKWFWNEKIEIEKRYPELNKELSARSSRDRIARGTIINLIPITILYWSHIHVFGIILLGLSIAMWVRFEHYNRCFELRAAYSLRNETVVSHST